MKIKLLVVLLLVGLVIIGYCSSRNNNLLISDIEKYSNDISVEYTLRSKYGIRSYILNINNNSVAEATKSVMNNTENKYAEFDGYHVDKIKGVKAIYDIDNNVVLEIESVAKKFDSINYECTLLKYDRADRLMYLLLHGPYPNRVFAIYDMNTGEVDEITKTCEEYNGSSVNVSYERNNNTIYILNNKNELCEYNFDTRIFKNLHINPKCYSVADNKIIYLDKDGIYGYDIRSATINKLSPKPKRFVIDLYVNRDATFILVIEELFGHTEIFDHFLRWSTHNMNCLKLYELSTGKSKVLVDRDREHYVVSADFLEKE